MKKKRIIKKQYPRYFKSEKDDDIVLYRKVDSNHFVTTFTKHHTNFASVLSEKVLEKRKFEEMTRAEAALYI